MFMPSGVLSRSATTISFRFDLRRTFLIHPQLTLTPHSQSLKA